MKVKPIKLGEVEFKPLIPELNLIGRAIRELPKEDYLWNLSVQIILMTPLSGYIMQIINRIQRNLNVKIG